MLALLLFMLSILITAILVPVLLDESSYPVSKMYELPTVETDDTSPTRVYIHVALMNDWREVLTHLLTQCQQHLPPHTVIKIVALGPHQYVPELNEVLAGFAQATLRHHTTDISGYERPTLGLLWDDAQAYADPTRILYLHTKGVSNKHINDSKRRYNIRVWVDFMLYHLVEKCDVALSALQMVDTCGVLLRNKPKNHFHGNFWWATAAHVRTLPGTIDSDYVSPEMWVNNKPNVQIATLAQSHWSHYFKALVPNRKAKIHIMATKPHDVADQYVPTRHKYPTEDLIVLPVPDTVEPKPIHVYIHAALMNDWHEVLIHLLTQCQRFLPDETTTISIVALGAEKHVPKLETLLATFPRATLRHHAVDISDYERPTLGLMWDDAQVSDAHVLYMHTKGVSDKHIDAPKRRHNIRMWVDFMLYYLVEQCSVALASLETSDTCGVLLRKQPSLHFHGNFWWATAAHIRTLSRTIDSDYFAPEMWVNVGARVATLAQTDLEHYNRNMPLNRVAKVCPRSTVRVGKVDVK